MSRRESRNKKVFSLGRSSLESLDDIGTSRTSLVDKVFTLVAGAIQTGKVSAGSRLPSVRQLADDCQFSRDTAARAYDKLVAHGLIESRRGSGYYVKASATERPQSFVPKRRSHHYYMEGLDQATRLRFLLQRPTQGMASVSGIGSLPEVWIDETAIAGALRMVARGSRRGTADAGDPQGYLPLRQQIQLKLQEMELQADPAQMILTSGATEAISLVVQTFLRSPMEYVLLEQPCQPMLIDRMLSVGLNIAFVPRLADGPDLDVLRTKCQEHKPRYFFCNSALHNPTGGYLAPHKAFQILRMAEEFDLTIIEDDTYCDFVPRNHASSATRLAPMDQLHRVIYVGSFSKILAPGLRVGFLVADPRRIEWLATYKALHSLASNSFAERTVHRLLSEGGYRHHCEQLRARLSTVRVDVIDALLAIDVTADAGPDAGLFLWADLGDGVDAMEVAEKMLERGHLTAPGPLFSSSTSYKSYMRFNAALTLDSGVLDALAQVLGRVRR
jgi:DNA-binding transcriptional MocR family regulator